jgi:hypothetical protein
MEVSGFFINSTYCNLLRKTGVFLNVKSAPEVDIGIYMYVKRIGSLKVRGTDLVPVKQYRIINMEVSGFFINSTYRNLLRKTGVFLNVKSGPKVGIGIYVYVKRIDSVKARGTDPVMLHSIMLRSSTYLACGSWNSKLFVNYDGKLIYLQYYRAVH